MQQNPVMEEWYKKKGLAPNAQGRDPVPHPAPANCGKALESFACRRDSQRTVLRHPAVIIVEHGAEDAVNIHVDDAI